MTLNLDCDLQSDEPQPVLPQHALGRQPPCPRKQGPKGKVNLTLGTDLGRVDEVRSMPVSVHGP